MKIGAVTRALVASVDPNLMHRVAQERWDSNVCIVRRRVRRPRTTCIRAPIGVWVETEGWETTSRGDEGDEEKG